MSNHSPNIASLTEIDRLLHHMPSVAAYGENEWAAGFAHSVLGQSRRKSWQPSPKQLSVMRRLVSDLFAHASDEDGEIHLIE